MIDPTQKIQLGLMVFSLDSLLVTMMSFRSILMLKLSFLFMILLSGRGWIQKSGGLPSE